MQIFAFDDKGCLISSLQAQKRKNYICPECHRAVRLKSGLYRRSHFYHLYSLSSCKLGKNSPLHLSVQLFLEKNITDLSLEVSFPQIKRIADCVWESKKIIFEIQCSPITKEEVDNRIKDYSSLGYKVVWILHEKSFHKRRASEAEIFLQTFPHYYTNIKLSGEGIIYDRLFHLEKGKRLFSSPQVLVHVNKPIFPPFNSSLKLRNRHWYIAFEGDLLSQKSQVIPQKSKSYFLTNFLRDLVEILHQ